MCVLSFPSLGSIRVLDASLWFCLKIEINQVSDSKAPIMAMG